MNAMLMYRTPGTPSQADEIARKAASDAAAIAENARQMVLNRDPAAASTAGQTQAALSAADAAIAKADALAATTAAHTAALAAMLGPMSMASGQAKTASLLALGGSVDLVVTLSRTMPSTTYNVEVIPISSALIAGNATIVVKAKTATTVTLGITAGLAVAASSIVSVLAWGW